MNSIALSPGVPVRLDLAPGAADPAKSHSDLRDVLAHGTAKRASPQTIACYRDTFRLLLRFMRERTGAEPTALPLAALDAEAVLAFLDHVERDRGCLVRSRNNRLAAIRSFFRLVAMRVPDSLGQVTRMMAIPVKRGDKRLVHYLSRDEVKALLAAPDRTAWSGRRDHALLLTLYNSGARVSEITALRREQVRLDPAGPCLDLHGKGRKQRVVPLWTETARVLRAWFRELGNQGSGVAFPSARGRALSRDGVDYLLRGAVAAAMAACPSLGTKKVSPHVLRHSTAMHLFQAGVGHGGDRALARARELGNDPRLCGGRPGHQGAGARQAGADAAGNACPLPPRRQASGLPRHPLIMPNRP